MIKKKLIYKTQSIKINFDINKIQSIFLMKLIEVIKIR